MRRHALGVAIGFAAAIGVGGNAQAQAQFAPTITGTVRIGLHAGTVAGNVCLTGFPPSDTMTIVLSRSLSILDSDGARVVPELAFEEPGGDAVRHTLARVDGGSDEAASDSVCVRYAGGETVYDVRAGRFREDDSSRVIAFNGTTVRARGSARWYPALFDPAIELAAEAESYRMTIVCDECRWIYMNGAAPLPGPVATFTSDIPRELFLLAGDFPITSVGGASIIGETVAPDSASRFIEWLTRIRRFHEGFVGVPFGDDLVVIRVDPVREPRRGLIWGFYSDPALTLTGMTIPEFVAVLDGRPDSARRAILGFLSHELSHRYFGWRLGWHSAQRDLFGEPFATYIELKAVRHFIGDDAYRMSLRTLVDRAERGPEQPRLDLAGAEEFSHDSFRYGYAPLQLFALEGIIGEPLTRALLQAVITAPRNERATADFDFLRRKALSIGVTPAEWREWEERCIALSPSESGCFRAIVP